MRHSVKIPDHHCIDVSPPPSGLKLTAAAMAIDPNSSNCNINFRKEEKEEVKNIADDDDFAVSDVAAAAANYGSL